MTTSRTVSLERSHVLFHDLTYLAKPDQSSTVISHATRKHVANIESLKEMCDRIKVDNNYMNNCRELVKIFFENLDNDLEKSYNLVVDESSKLIVYPKLEIILLHIMLFPIDVKPFQYDISKYIEINSIIDKKILNIIKKYHTHFDINYNVCQKYKLGEIMINCNMIYSSEFCFKNLKQTLYTTFYKCVSNKLEIITQHKDLCVTYEEYKNYSNILEELVTLCNFTSTTYDKYEKFKELKLLQKENEDLKENLKRITELDALRCAEIQLVDEKLELLQKENQALKENLKKIAEIEELRGLIDEEFESI